MSLNSSKNDNEMSFQEALAFSSDKEKFEHEALMISFRFLSEIERVMGESEALINKKGLASKIGTSSSYITQLFRGNKVLNFVTLAKIQDALGIVFEIHAKAKQVENIDQTKNLLHLTEMIK